MMDEGGIIWHDTDLVCLSWLGAAWEKLTHWGRDKIKGLDFADSIFKYIFLNENV